MRTSPLSRSSTMSSTGSGGRSNVARIITEDTRGIIAEETRREALLTSIKSLQKDIRRRKDAP